MDLVGINTCNHVVGEPEVKYVLSTCPRCLGKGVYGDVLFDDHGKLKTYQGASQLKQQLQKLLVENKRRTGYGFDYTLLKGTIDSSRTMVIQREIARLLNYFITTQQLEKGDNYYYRSTEELKESISIKVYQDSLEPRKVIALIAVRTVSNTVEEASIILRR